MPLNGYLLGALCGAGISGNLLAVVVLQRDDKKNSTNWKTDGSKLEKSRRNILQQLV